MTNATKPVQLLRLPEVLIRTGLGRSTIWSLIAQGRFPRQVKLSERSSAWVDAEVDAWVAQRVAMRDSGIAPAS
ncbi:AlpA family transcriptional regulator [Pseudoxanthomonas sp.]|jgi:prophage regulatory protein|uniref:helix-turn-helix transcriptional regulator n=1 Tax=Pseudoxanthomonas sp. TaxID=1871049 RepID=UPI002E11B005|nr:AlpA family transcriptional regulator [Pseudoxanthomonas sp.]